jgi:uncharacterized membrane protein YgcG
MNGNVSRRLLLLLLPLLLTLVLAAPAAAHDEGAVELPDRLVDGIPAEVHGDPVQPGQDARLRQSTTLAAARTALTRNLLADAAVPTLAGTWCGTPRSTDDTVNASTGTGASIKVVYAYPSDVSSQFATRADLIQQDARDIASSFSLAATGLKTVRFDVGTSCGDPYLDIASIQLPRTKAAYVAMTLNARVTALQNDLASFSAGLSGTHDVLVYIEDLNAGDGIAGVATLFDDDRPGAANYSNRGGQFAFVLGLLSGSGRRNTAQHELGHNLGAVQDSAPHSTLAGHCFERYDVMCYADGGTKGQVSDLTYPSGCTSFTPQAWDCDRGDYFDPAPAAGTYLATHWNLFNSVFLCAPATCFTDDGTVGGPGSSTTVPPTGGSGSGGSSGGSGGSSGGSGATTTTPTTPTPTTPTPPPTPPTVVPPPRIVPATPVVAAPTISEQVRDALDAVQSGFVRVTALKALRAGRTVRVHVTVPAGGSLAARLTVRGRTVVRTTVDASAFRRAMITLKPSAKARRTLRGARPRQLALHLVLR